MEMNYEEILPDEEEQDEAALAAKMEQSTTHTTNLQRIPPYSAFFIFAPNNK